MLIKKNVSEFFHYWKIFKRPFIINIAMKLLQEGMLTKGIMEFA